MSARPLVIAASVLLFSFAASYAHASFIQQGAKLVGTGAVGSAIQGSSVAVSADGNTAVVGGAADDGDAGATWVFIDPSPAIASITDVPNDQGGKVSIR